MKALSVKPGDPASLGIDDVPLPGTLDGSILARTLAIGICGTDLEIINEGYGEPPEGQERLILGHESLGEVVEAPPESGFLPGQLVVGMVRRPDPEPCIHCSRGEVDMCRNGLYSERGILGLHGYASEVFRLQPEFAVPVDPKLGVPGVLIEPASVVAKAGDHALHMLRRENIPVSVALVTGAGPIGLLAAMMLCRRGIETHVVDIVEDGPKPDLVRRIGAYYHAGSPTDLKIQPEAIIECTGIGKVATAAGAISAPGAVMALTGIAASSTSYETDLNAMNRRLVLGNRVVFGSVNAARRHYELAANALAAFDQDLLSRLISRRVPLDRWREAMTRQPDDLKVVLDFDGSMSE
jgi:threonine dehydrogenase-like Zn-dependent dehydrogenase